MAGLLAVATTVQIVVIARATSPALDAVRFVGIARQIDQQGLLPAVRQTSEQPLFPVWLWLVHGQMERIGGPSPSLWADAAQVAAAIPLVLAVVPLYFLLLRLVGPAAAIAGSLFFCVLPEVSRLGADGISDSLHLLWFILALWAMVTWPRRPTVWALLAGVATALALMTRVEVAVLAVAFAVMLVWQQCRAVQNDTSNRWAPLKAAAVYGLGLLLVLGPYVAATDAGASRAAVDRLLGRGPDRKVAAEPPPGWRLADAEPMSFDTKEHTTSLRRRGYPAAVGQYAEHLADAFHYWIGLLAIFGAWRLAARRRVEGDFGILGFRDLGNGSVPQIPKSLNPKIPRSSILQLFFALFSVLVIQFTAREGYLTPRHLVTLVVVGLPAAGYGAIELGAVLARSASEGRRRVDLPRLRFGLVRPTWTLVVLLAAACLPQTFKSLHRSRSGHREAGQWLAATDRPAGAVLDTRGFSGLYSGRTTYRFDQAAAALRDPTLAYLVVESGELEYDSPRGRTLRRLAEMAGGRPVGTFVLPQRRTSTEPPSVLVFSCGHARFRAQLAASTGAGRPGTWR